MFGLDTYQLFDSNRLTRCQPRRILDIGAHVGSFTLAVLAQLPDAFCVAYEASPTTFEYLRDNLHRNGAVDRVAAVSAAVTDMDGLVALRGGTQADGSASIIPTLGTGEAVVVEAVAFDRVVDEQGPFEVVKLDCEGAEYGIVLSSRDESWDRVRYAVLEYHGVAGHSWPELQRRFNDLGLSVAMHEPRAGGFGVAHLSRARDRM